MRNDKWIVYWKGMPVGNIEDIDIETFHVSGKWKSHEVEETKKFLQCFKNDNPEVIVELDNGLSRLKGRLYEAPDDYIELNLIP